MSVHLRDRPEFTSHPDNPAIKLFTFPGHVPERQFNETRRHMAMRVHVRSGKSTDSISRQAIRTILQITGPLFVQVENRMTYSEH